MDRIDICIIGAGAVGLAIAYQLSHSKAFENRSILLLDSLQSFGQSTSSRNSEVIHAGIYYPPGSLKAKLCLEGKEMLYKYLARKDIPHRKVGKLIVAGANQEQALQAIQRNAELCDMGDLQWLEGSQLKQYEPQLNACYALLSPSTGILDSHAYMASLLTDCQQQSVMFAANTKVAEISPQDDGFKVTTLNPRPNHKLDEYYDFSCQNVINAAGLGAHHLAEKIQGLNPKSVPKVHYCKGDYFTYNKPSPFSHLIYPVPEPHTAGLGIHSTLDLGNQLRFGPDTEYVNEARYDVSELKREKFALAIQRYFPSLDPASLRPDYAGIRPKLSGPGEPAADFMIQSAKDHGVDGLIQLFGIESPGLTASLAIGMYVTDLLNTP